jgi:hypothetical protein
MKNKDVVKEYNSLLNKKKLIEDRLSNTQREKDYKVQLIERKYQTMIDRDMNELDAIDGIIKTTQIYISKHPDTRQ